MVPKHGVRTFPQEPVTVISETSLDLKINKDTELGDNESIKSPKSTESNRNARKRQTYVLIFEAVEFVSAT